MASHSTRQLILIEKASKRRRSELPRREDDAGLRRSRRRGERDADGVEIIGRRIRIFLSGIGYRILPRRTDRISDIRYRISESDISISVAPSLGVRARQYAAPSLPNRPSSAVHGAEPSSLYVQLPRASKPIKIIEKWMKIVDMIEMKCP